MIMIRIRIFMLVIYVGNRWILRRALSHFWLHFTCSFLLSLSKASLRTVNLNTDTGSIFCRRQYGYVEKIVSLFGYLSRWGGYSRQKKSRQSAQFFLFSYLVWTRLRFIFFHHLLFVFLFSFLLFAFPVSFSTTSMVLFWSRDDSTSLICVYTGIYDGSESNIVMKYFLGGPVMWGENKVEATVLLMEFFEGCAFDISYDAFADNELLAEESRDLEEVKLFLIYKFHRLYHLIKKVRSELKARIRWKELWDSLNKIDLLYGWEKLKEGIRFSPFANHLKDHISLTQLFLCRKSTNFIKPFKLLADYEAENTIKKIASPSPNIK